MKLLIKLLIFFFLLLSACSRKSSRIDNLCGVEWESSKLQRITFDSVWVGVQQSPSEYIRKYKYSVHSDTLQILNDEHNVHNSTGTTDHFFLFKIYCLTKDTLVLEPLNHGARSLFNLSKDVTFYNVKNIDRFSYYFEKDSICKMQINQAREEVRQGKLSYCMEWHFRFRQKSEFEKVLARYNIRLVENSPKSDCCPTGRDGYTETMNYYFFKKYGRDFIVKLKHEADSLQVINSPNHLYESFECDTDPFLVDEGKEGKDFNIYCDDMNSIRYSSEMNPEIVLNFIVNKNGTLSDIKFVRQFYKTYKKEKENVLIRKAISELKLKYSKWYPGIVWGKKVNSAWQASFNFVPRKKIQHQSSKVIDKQMYLLPKDSTMRYLLFN